MKHIIVLYHAHCPDGFGAAWAAWKKFKDKAEYIGMQYGDKLPENLEGKEIYIVDFGLKEALMKQVIKKARRVVALDHHLSAEASTKMASEYEYDIEKSGAGIAWNYFHPKKRLPVLLQHIQAFDLWKFTLKNTHEISSYINSFPFDFIFWDKVERLLENAKTRAAVVKEGAAIVRYQNGIIERGVKNAYLVSFGGERVLAANSSVLKDQIGNALVKEGYPFSIIWSHKSEKVVVSLRADGKYDVSKLAEKHGGGGHKNASAFTFPLNKKIPWKIIKK